MDNSPIQSVFISLLERVRLCLPQLSSFSIYSILLHSLISCDNAYFSVGVGFHIPYYLVKTILLISIYMR